MSGLNAEGTVSGMEHLVADYLRAHPDFFARHPDLAAEMEVSHPCGRAVSLIEYQVLVLRDQTRLLRRRLQDLVATARENEQLSERVHGLSLELLACAALPGVLATLYRALRESFGAEHAAVRLFAAPGSPEDAGLAEFLGTDERARRLLAPILGVASPLCGRVPEEQARALFGAIGSADESRYQPGMATTFLRQLADVASERMRGFLVLTPEVDAAPAEAVEASVRPSA
ncbi:MAG: DUF484 family protein [Gammaproteobacteria bacterium]|nr:DUF484 family protein [Gammaproteobacteria bacterium]